jgi:hypothetical protein
VNKYDPNKYFLLHKAKGHPWKNKINNSKINSGVQGSTKKTYKVTNDKDTLIHLMKTFITSYYSSLLSNNSIVKYYFPLPFI